MLFLSYDSSLKSCQYIPKYSDVPQTPKPLGSIESLNQTIAIVRVQVYNRQSLMRLNLRNSRFSAETLRERHFDDHFDRIFNFGGAIE